MPCTRGITHLHLPGMQGRFHPIFQVRKLRLRVVKSLPEGTQWVAAQLEFELWSV